MLDSEAEQACHNLLVRLAGRLDDRLLWRYRDWLSEGAVGTLARTLPKSLLKYRIDLEESDYRLLVSGLVPYGADRNQVSSTLGVDEPVPRRYTFTTESPTRVNSVDSVSTVVHATLRGRPDVGEVRESWRYGDDERQGEPRRVLLVTALSGAARLTGELQRVLRALGDEDPSVEVLGPRVEHSEYHRAALGQSWLVCVGAAGGESGRVPA